MPNLTPDNRYILVDGVLWRATNPNLAPEARDRAVKDLMNARREVKFALQTKDKEAEKAARAHVQKAKVALGERGPVWWDDGAPDYNRMKIENTPYGKGAKEPKDETKE